MGGTRIIVVVAVLLIATTLFNVPAGAAVGLPPGFSVDTVTSGLDNPTSIVFAPDGSIFITEKRGRVLKLDGPDDNTPTLVKNIQRQVHNNSDRGLTALAADPTDSNLIYIGYSLDRVPGGSIPTYGSDTGNYDPCPDSATTGCPALSRVSRLNVENGNETVLFEGHCQQFPFHTVGDLLFDNSGNLVVTFGDGSTGSFVEYGQRGNFCGDPGGPAGTNLSAPLTEGGQGRSQDLLTRDDPTGVHGAVLRVNRTNFAPAGGNPMASDPEPLVASMVATGFRNPFRAEIDPSTGRYYVGNVGGAGHEEIQSFQPGDLANSGWPCYEGPGTTQNTFWLTTNICDQLVNSGEHDPPIFSYRRNTPLVPGENCSNGGLSISGLAINRSGFGTGAMNGGLFFTDYTRACIWYLPSDGAGGVVASPRVFATEIGGLVDLGFGPDGALYGVDILGNQVMRFSSGEGPQPPVAVISAEPVEGAPTRTVLFDASGSFDPNPGDSLSYAWDFEDDGANDQSGITVTYRYPTDGEFTARLTVTDNTGRSSIAKATFTFGGEPSATITEPSAGRTFKVGAVVPVRSTITASNGDPLPSSAADWELILHHCIPGGGCHTHGLEAVQGANGSFVMPDHEYPSNVELVLTVDDPNGGTSIATTDANYRTVDVDVTSQPVGLPVLVGSTEETTPFTREVAVGATTSVAVADPVTVGGVTFGFTQWRLDGDAAGGSPALEFAPTANTTLRADFVADNDPDDERPTPPRGLDATGIPGGVRLDWRASTDNVGVANYQIYRSTNGTLGSLYATVGDVTTWTDTAVEPGTTYTYGLRAVDAAGNQSWRSNLEEGTPSGGGGGPDTERPTAPSGLRATERPWGIRLTWNASTDNVAVANYIIYRSTDGSVGAPWRTIDGQRLEYSNGNAQAGVTYTYTIRARDAAGNLSWRSNLASATGPG